ncbi:MAG: hypothetical protein IJO44_03010 [Clostridia bacterium]|nr:hypothetical protein [Clostridia bacterium]
MIRKIFSNKAIKILPVVMGIVLSVVGLLVYPKEASDGIRAGLSIIGSDILPSLFPFMVVSSYVADNSFIQKLGVLTDKFTKKFLRTNGFSLIAFLLGIMGGYPVGAKTIRDYYVAGKLTQNEAERLFYWCINPSPAFTITAVGLLMMGSIQTGGIIYLSCILASITIGFFCRFLNDDTVVNKIDFTVPEKSENSFVKSVSSGTEAMLGICGWVLILSAFSSVISALPLNEAVKLFIKSVCEVTTGCNTAIESRLPVAVVTAVVGFGGFAVICQINSFASACNVKPSRLICSRVINSSISVVYYSLITKIFPQYTQAAVVIGTNENSFILYKSIPVTILLLMMCVLLILEVDNRKKVW